MQPQIEYATAPDGKRIATLTFGAGAPLLIAATPPWSHVHQEMTIPPVRAWLQAIAEQAQVVRYDCRGTGLSDRHEPDFSLDAQVRDLETVANHYGLRSFAIWGAIGGSPAAIAYTARHPERVSHLILWGAYTRGVEFLGGDIDALHPLMIKNWHLYTDTYSQAAFGWADSDTGARYAALMRAAITQEAMVEAMRQMTAVDVESEARAITTPTLVLVGRDAKYLGVDHARQMAALIPDARLQIFDGLSHAPFLGDTAPLIATLQQFIATEPAPRGKRPLAAPLTQRETQVLRLLASGSSAREIGAELRISIATAQRHIANLYTKIGARGRVDAVAYAFEAGLAHTRHPRSTT